MRHIDWIEEGSAEYYSRLSTLVKSDFVAGRLAANMKDARMIEERYRERIQLVSLD